MGGAQNRGGSVTPPGAHDPTGTELALRIAAAARGEPVRWARRGREPVDVAWSGAGESARDPHPAAAVLRDVMAARGWTPTVSVTALMARWPEFVGAVNAAHTRPERFADGVLVVRAESTTWAAALRTMLPLVRTKLNGELGAETIARISVIGPSAPSWKKGRRSIPGRGPRDTYG